MENLKNEPLVIEQPKAPAAVIKSNPAKVTSFKALLTSVDDAANGDFVLNFGTPDGDIKTLWVASKYWAILVRRIKEGDYLQVKCETRVAGKTTYEDADGTTAYHTKDSDSFVSATRIGRQFFDAEIPVNQKDIDTITSAPSDGMSMALASYLSAYRAAIITAK